MFARYFDEGGPLMYTLFAAWVIVLAGVLDRLLYALGRARRRPMREIAALVSRGERASARALLKRERRRAEKGLVRIDAVSQIATSLGLFGTVVGLAQTFFERGASVLGLAAPEILASGLATALFTTVAGLIVFLFGQAFLLTWDEWQSFLARGVREELEEPQP